MKNHKIIFRASFKTGAIFKRGEKEIYNLLSCTWHDDPLEEVRNDNGEAVVYVDDQGDGNFRRFKSLGPVEGLECEVCFEQP
tara:strand:- start:374 stop:619 length:246 start_codon:yes stop_codon:yes gene_type:complete